MSESSSQLRMDLVAKPGAKSALWDYFGLEKGRDGQPIDNGNVICRTCYRRVLAKNGNTSNLLAHLKANHGKVYSEATEAMNSKPSRQPSIRSKGIAVGQSTLKESLERGQKYERKGKKWKELTDAVTYYIAKDSLPVYSVDTKP